MNELMILFALCMFHYGTGEVQMQGTGARYRCEVKMRGTNARYRCEVQMRGIDAR